MRLNSAGGARQITFGEQKLQCVEIDLNLMSQYVTRRLGIGELPASASASAGKAVRLSESIGLTPQKGGNVQMIVFGNRGPMKGPAVGVKRARRRARSLLARMCSGVFALGRGDDVRARRKRRGDGR